ncbi:trypsin-1-like [Palaemon carinicauda]|uniref:trypsin-1-like n=1 Tax=Palaemon carinicauda TaxID=392227 RepID=UPI0035B58515
MGTNQPTDDSRTYVKRVASFSTSQKTLGSFSMKSLWWILVTVFVCKDGQCRNVNKHWASSKSDSQINIIGGEVAEHGEFPYQVSVQHKGIFGQIHVCGGSVLDKMYVLTSANCIESISAKNIRVIAGMTSLAKDVDTKQEVRVTSKVIHEKYSSVTRDNDIALLKLEQELILNDLVRSIELPIEDVPDGSICIMTGWGATTPTGDRVDDLHKVQIPVVDSTICRTFYGESAISDGMVCAGKITGGSGSCEGDMGGPLQCEGVLQGIYSWGKGCAEPASPGVYTKVIHYKEWIEDFILIH